MSPAYQREKNGERLDFLGINTVLPPDILPPGKYPYAQNVRRYVKGGIAGRALQDAAIETLAGTGGVHSLRRLNDSTPAGPVSGFVIIGGAGVNLYAGAASVSGALSGKTVSLVPFRPNTSVQPWMYVADSNVMLKVRSDGTTFKDGIAEPQVAPSVVFVGGGTGVSQINYRYVYRGSATGAQSNPSPESPAGTNAAGNQAITGPFPSGVSFDPSQWSFVSSQLRTTAAATSSPQILSPAIQTQFGFTIPAGVTITGIVCDLNWQSQSATSASLAKVNLVYQGVQLGVAKNPGTAPQTTAADAIVGSNGDTWGANLTSAIVNDPSFGFSIQISVQTVRLFLNGFKITVYYESQNANITPTASTDPQVDKIDFYRFSSNVASWVYVGTGPNTATAFNDIQNDAAVAGNPLLQFDNFEPFPSIDLPRKGVVSVAAGGPAGTMAVTWTSGDHFNVRWLPGTVMLIGGVAYTLYNRPTSTTTLLVILPGALPGTLTGLTFEIAEPILAAQPLPYMCGPTDNVAFMFAVGDPLRPGVLYWTKGNNPDSAPDTNQQDQTSPSEPLQNVCLVNGIGMVFSTERAWMIWPNFFNALATVTGTTGSTWTLQESITDRGLYIPRCLAVNGGKDVYFRTKDGICVSPNGSGAASITDDDLYNLFPHEGMVPQNVTIGGFTIFPPDDTKPNAQRFCCANGYLYYDYQDVSGTPRTLVYDIAAKGWVPDVYQFPATVHMLEEGAGVNGTLTGNSDGSVRPLTNTGAETATSVVLIAPFTAGEQRAQKHFGDLYIEAGHGV